MILSYTTINPPYSSETREEYHNVNKHQNTKSNIPNRHIRTWYHIYTRISPIQSLKIEKGRMKWSNKPKIKETRNDRRNPRNWRTISKHFSLQSSKVITTSTSVLHELSILFPFQTILSYCNRSYVESNPKWEPNEKYHHLK